MSYIKMKGEIRGLQKLVDHWKHNHDDEKRKKQTAQAVTRLYLDKLKDLLAVIHRDGGHYTQEHGLNKSLEDAMKRCSDNDNQEYRHGYYEFVLVPMMELETPVRISQGWFDRWMVVKADGSFCGWSGSRWVPLDGDVAVSNFSTKQEAVEYATSFGFTVVE